MHFSNQPGAPYLDTREDIASAKIRALGFCMGGGMAIGAAASYPRRFAAVASFHGGNLATDAPTSPHLLVPELAARLEDALTKAGVPYRAEIYRGASHGWMVPDFPVYDRDSADRGWNAMLAFFEHAPSG
jgi:carboxymethylenebutenolidase